jgi:hypothetical protein
VTNENTDEPTTETADNARREWLKVDDRTAVDKMRLFIADKLRDDDETESADDDRRETV